MMRQQRVAGLIIVPTCSDAEHGRRLRAEIHVPALLLDMSVEGLGFDVVKLDNVRATRLATEHLIGLGHRRNGVLTGLAGLVISADRLQGYLDAHEVAGLKVDSSLLLPGNFEQATAFASVSEVMRRWRPPTALVSFSNMMTLGAMLALRELGLNIPQDASLVGIDDLDFANLLTPPPTVVRAPVAETAKRSVRLLLEELETKRRPLSNLEVYPP